MSRDLFYTGNGYKKDKFVVDDDDVSGSESSSRPKRRRLRRRDRYRGDTEEEEEGDTEEEEEEEEIIHEEDPRMLRIAKDFVWNRNDSVLKTFLTYEINQTMSFGNVSQGNDRAMSLIRCGAVLGDRVDERVMSTVCLLCNRKTPDKTVVRLNDEIVAVLSGGCAERFQCMKDAAIIESQLIALQSRVLYAEARYVLDDSTLLDRLKASDDMEREIEKIAEEEFDSITAGVQACAQRLEGLKCRAERLYN